MQRRFLLLASLLTMAVAQAQSVVPAPQANDDWNRPAPAASTGYHAAAPSSSRAPASHFKFRERRNLVDLPGNAAQQESGKARVGGMGEMDRNGRPAVNCPQTPMDPACH